MSSSNTLLPSNVDTSVEVLSITSKGPCCQLDSSAHPSPWDLLFSSCRCLFQMRVPATLVEVHDSYITGFVQLRSTEEEARLMSTCQGPWRFSFYHTRVHNALAYGEERPSCRFQMQFEVSPCSESSCHPVTEQTLNVVFGIFSGSNILLLAKIQTWIRKD